MTLKLEPPASADMSLQRFEVEVQNVDHVVILITSQSGTSTVLVRTLF